MKSLSSVLDQVGAVVQRASVEVVAVRWPVVVAALALVGQPIPSPAQASTTDPTELGFVREHSLVMTSESGFGHDSVGPNVRLLQHGVEFGSYRLGDSTRRGSTLGECVAAQCESVREERRKKCKKNTYNTGILCEYDAEIHAGAVGMWVGLLAYWLLGRRIVRPNVRAKRATTAGRQAREGDDIQHGLAGLVACRWRSA
jgi:hypothetical protein